jgi:hypothetical protein
VFCLRFSDYQLVMKVFSSDTSREYRVMLRGFVWQDTLELREDICCMWRFPKNNGTTEGFQRGYLVRTGHIGNKLTGHMGYTLDWANALEKYVINGTKTTICKLGR